MDRKALSAAASAGPASWPGAVAAGTFGSCPTASPSMLAADWAALAVVVAVVAAVLVDPVAVGGGGGRRASGGPAPRRREHRDRERRDGAATRRPRHAA